MAKAKKAVVKADEGVDMTKWDISKFPKKSNSTKNIYLGYHFDLAKVHKMVAENGGEMASAKVEGHHLKMKCTETEAQHKARFEREILKYQAMEKQAKDFKNLYGA